MSNTTTTATSATATSVNRPGRPTGFRIKYTMKASVIQEGIDNGSFTGEEKMTIVAERKRTPAEIQAIIAANLDKLTDAAFMAGITVERLAGGKTLSEIIEDMDDDEKVEIARVDISNFYDRKKEDALCWLTRCSEKEVE
jgi:hypothetical protein